MGGFFDKGRNHVEEFRIGNLKSQSFRSDLEQMFFFFFFSGGRRPVASSFHKGFLGIKESRKSVMNKNEHWPIFVG